MNHKHLLTAAVLSLLPNLGVADTVYYCQIKEFADVGIDGVQRWKPQQFTMKVTENGVVFGGDGFLKNLFFLPGGQDSDYYNFTTDKFWTAGDKWSSSHFSDGIFVFSMINTKAKALVNIIASCDSF